MCPKVEYSRKRHTNRRKRREGEKDIAMVIGANEVVQTNWQNGRHHQTACQCEADLLAGEQSAVWYSIESGHETPFGIEDNVYFLDFLLHPSSKRLFWTAGMGHSSVDDSLVKNLLSPFVPAYVRRF